MSRMRPGRRVLIGCALLLAGTEVAAAQESGAPVRKRTAYEDLQMFSQVLNQIRVNHPDSIDTHDLLMAAVEGMVRAADPHSYVLPAMRLAPEKEKAMREGRLVSLPVSFTYLRDAPVVLSVAPGSGAARQDILPGDELVAADGRPITATSAAELDVHLAGPRGSEVRLSLERRHLDGSRVRLERTVRRERAGDETSAPAVFMLDDRTGYLRVTGFVEKTAEDVHGALERLERSGMRRLVLDLRDNGGGRVDQAAKVAGEFLPKGSLVYTSEGRKAEVGDSVRVTRSFWRRERPYPIVVLVNEGTASAAELVTGALQDHDRALVAGRATFGKSLLMQPLPLADGSLIMLVIGHLKTPCGRIVQRQYRTLSNRDYHRLAGVAADTVGRPSCRTTGGRTVYGGGGIYPDALLPAPDPAPHWLTRVYEADLPLRWSGAYLAEHGGRFSSLEALLASPTLPSAAAESFRALAEGAGIAIPAGAEASARLDRLLLRTLALARWREEGYFRISAVLDPEVRAAVGLLEKAEGILR